MGVLDQIRYMRSPDGRKVMRWDSQSNKQKCWSIDGATWEVIGQRQSYFMHGLKYVEIEEKEALKLIAEWRK